MKNFIRSKPVTSYISIVLFTTWVITGLLFINPDIGMQAFALIMFMPATVAFVLNKISQKSNQLFFFHLLKDIKKIRKPLLFAILYPVVFVIICGVFSLLLKIGKVNEEFIFSMNSIITILVSIFIGLFSAWGEEYGWRGYLLPKLTDKFGHTKATALVGVVWAIYHMPIVFLLAKFTGITNPLIICLVQGLAAFCISFPTAYCYYISKNLLPPILIHSVWNNVNTFILGDIYTNKQGLIRGNIFYTNGEGIAGVILGTIMIFVFIKLFKNLGSF